MRAPLISSPNLKCKVSPTDMGTLDVEHCSSYQPTYLSREKLGPFDQGLQLFTGPLQAQKFKNSYKDAEKCSAPTPMFFYLFLFIPSILNPPHLPS